MQAIHLGVNIDHVATLRQARLTSYPDPIQAALDAEQAGADSITLHLREDRRHVQERDVYELKEVMFTPMNLEMAVTEEMLAFAEKIRPQFCCLVPERREELTTEGGLDVIAQLERIREACRRLSEAGIRTSLFIDPQPEQITAAHEAGAGVIEIHTGHFADAKSQADSERELDRLIGGARHGVRLGLQVNAGHGLNYRNVKAVAAIPEVRELNIGHSIVARALFTGMAAAVREMKQLLWEARQ